MRSKRWLQGLVKVTCVQSGEELVGELVRELVEEIWLGRFGWSWMVLAG